MKEMGIYVIRNRVTAKRYVGGSTNIARRITKHKMMLTRNIHPNVPLQTAWNIYGSGGFRFEIIEIVYLKEHLVLREQYWMNHYKVRRGIYNLAPVAGSSLGRKATLETKLKISEATKGREVSTETRMKISKRHKGRSYSVLTLRRMSEAAKRRGPHSEEVIAKAAAANKGKVRTEEQRENIGRSLRGKPKSETHREALRKAWVLRKARSKQGE